MDEPRVIFRTGNDDWPTPQPLYDELDREFRFDLDAAASPGNAKCQHFFTVEDDALTKDWNAHGKVIWCNPPYGRGLGEWVTKAVEAMEAGSTVVMLLPARTDTKWFHEHAPKAELRFIRGRVKFGAGTGSAPFASMLLIFRPKWRGLKWITLSS